MQTILTIVQVFLSIALIALVLIQHGRGADAGAAFGSGASATVFGARGSGSFLSRATGILAALFFLTSMALAYYAAQGSRPAGLMDAADGMRVKVPAAEGPVQVPVPPITPSQGAPDVPVVPGVEARSPASDVPLVPGVMPAPVEPKPAIAPAEPALSPAPQQAPTVVPAVEPPKDEAAKPATPEQEQEQEQKRPPVPEALPQGSGAADVPKPELPPVDSVK